MTTRRPTIEILTSDGHDRRPFHAEPIPQSASVHTPDMDTIRSRAHVRQPSISPSLALMGNDLGDGISGRATRQRTQLIVEGFSNLALVAVLFSGVQAQLISITVDDNDNPLAMATNAVFFGGLMLSVFSAMLASLSGRWFSILREDDSEYLSSCWLATECNKKVPKLEDYLRFQLRVWEDKRSDPARDVEKQTPTSATSRDSIFPNPRDEDIERVLEIIRHEQESVGGPTTKREILMSKVLLSALIVCSLAFILFCAGIVMLVWNKLPRPLAVVTSGIVFVCISLIPMFFLKHRRKHVINRINLKRPAL